MGARVPADVIRPHLMRSRRETWPWEKAFTISARFCLACSASRSRALEALRGRKKWSFIAALLDLIETTSREHLQSFGTGGALPELRISACFAEKKPGSAVSRHAQADIQQLTISPGDIIVKRHLSRRILYREPGGENKRSARINFCRDAPPAWIVQ